MRNVDPSGLVKWSGSYRVTNAGIGKKIKGIPLRIGRNEITFNLESECINGKKMVVTLRSVNPDDDAWINLPFELYGGTSVEIEDSQSTPNANSLRGPFKMRFAAAGIGIWGKLTVGTGSGTLGRSYGIVFGEHDFSGNVDLLFPPKEVSCECPPN